MQFRIDTRFAGVSRFRIAGSQIAQNALPAANATGSAYDVVIDYDAGDAGVLNDGTVSISVNGTAFDFGGGNTTFSLANDFASNHVAFGGFAAANAGRFEFDNLNVVPEPASLALLASGGLMVLRRRRA